MLTEQKRVLGSVQNRTADFHFFFWGGMDTNGSERVRTDKEMVIAV